MDTVYYKTEDRIIAIDLTRRPTFRAFESKNNYPFWNVGAYYADRESWRDDIILLSGVGENEARAELERINGRLAQMGMML